MSAIAGSRAVRAPRGAELSCLGWPQEAALRMLMNNLDPEVAERPEDLVVYGGNGRAARSWEAFDAIVRTLRRLRSDETLIVQSGKPVAVFPTHARAPRVLIANANLVPKWADWTVFRELEAQGLTMYGQMTAGSWIYIGTQGIVQGTYETFAELGRRHFGGSLTGRVVLTAGVGGMGGAQPLAVTMNGGICLIVDVDRARLERRRELRYLDRVAESRDDALLQVQRARDAREAVSIGYEGNAAVEFAQLYELGFRPDAVTDQTSAHDLLNGYVPAGLSLAAAAELRRTDPDEYQRRALQSCAEHVRAMVRYLDAGAIVFDYGNNIRAQAQRAGFERAFDFPGFVPAFIRPLFCRGSGPFRFAALSGDPDDIAACDAKLLELFGDDASLTRWLCLARERIAFQGLPARICWLPFGRRAIGRAGIQRARCVGRGQGADRHRTRPSRYRQRSLALSRDRGDERRKRCDRRLADSQRDAQHGRRRALGELSSRRRRRHRLQPSCRNGSRCRRQRRCARAPRLRAYNRSRPRRRSPRRRRLRPRHRNRRRRRASIGVSDRPRQRRSSPATLDAPQCGIRLRRARSHRRRRDADRGRPHHFIWPRRCLSS